MYQIVQIGSAQPVQSLSGLEYCNLINMKFHLFCIAKNIILYLRQIFSKFILFVAQDCFKN
jgi:hypothetical protein